MKPIEVKTILMDVDGTMTRVINPKQEPQHHFWNILVNMLMEKYHLTCEAAEAKIRSCGDPDQQCLSTLLKPLNIGKQTYFDAIAEGFSHTIEVPEDTILFFQAMQKKGIPVCTATTNPPFFTCAKLAVGGIATLEGCKYLTRHHPGNEFNDPQGKFSPHFFPNILKHHGYDPAHTMMIGDEPKRDLYPALEAGIRYCVIIDRKQQEDIIEKEGGIFIRAYSVLINKIKNTGGLT